MDQTQREFLVEIEELVEQVSVDLDALRKAGTSRRVQRQLIDSIFRRVHSVKGLAGSIGLEVVSHIAHEFENLLDAARAGRIQLDEFVLETCESATDALSDSISLAASGIVEPSRQTLFKRLHTAARGDARVTDAETILENIPSEIWQALTDSEKQRLVAIVNEGNLLFIVSTSFEITSFDDQFFRLKEKLAKHGEVVSSSPTVDENRPDKINFRVLYASEADIKTLKNAAEFPDVTFSELKVPDKSSSEGDDKNASESPTLATVASLSNFVRTDLEKLDQLISSTHELFRSAINAFDLVLSHEKLPKRARQELLKLSGEVRSSFLSVADGLINLRMVSLGPMLQRAARAGRAAARQAAKEVDFEIAGADLQLDKLLADAIADPLIHLVRNAVDHAIEPADMRVQAGKKKRGTVRIEALSKGSQSRVRVTDDGRGIDPEVVSEAATRLGIVETDSPLDFERSMRIIFRPGFTTLDSVSDISGRGVGLDVVETAVEQVGGELGVSSQLGAGTTFEIRLPVTFGLLTATVVVSAGKRYCLPASQLVQDSSGAASHSKPSLENQLPPTSLRELLGQTAAESESGVFVDCDFADERATNGDSSKRRIAVDELIGTEEVLVRNLGRHSGRWYGVTGATELRDGSVALVLDLPRLLNSGTDSSL